MSPTTTTTTYTPPPLPPPFTNSPALLLAQGAEGRLYKTNFLTSSTLAALKVRPSKPYRHPILDSRLTRQRILQEARCLVKLSREDVPVPGLLALDVECDVVDNNNDSGGSSNWAAWLLMEWVEGIVVRQVVDRWEKWVKAREKKAVVVDDADGNSGDDAEIKRSQRELCALLRRIGAVVGAMHKAGIVHGDLTTSNLMLRPVGGATADAEAVAVPTSTSIAQDAELQILEHPSLEGEIVLIDFGLAAQSIQDEDRAVDLYVLERAFGSSHPRTERFFEEVLKGYAVSYKGANVVLKRLEQVRLRGRKRSMIG
ncbi:BUD32 protein kinase [Helicocarpus griseus UAMH5409]|uniref:EKC/KEOPS complex subunit BUD32 n=1 Tax=Helicocarpus griseus UAMH5409 TaxID=1447875 RepID=A0A2B7XHD0_9EURO|nr:BUD32 protein kinase [Helicocarpus griseus UAMH5409]